MTETREGALHRIYPIGALSEWEVTHIATDQLCAEELQIDALLNEWRAKARAFQSLPVPNLEVLDSEMLPLQVKAETLAKIDAVIKSYRDYFPTTYDLAFVPISKLISPQKSITYEHTQDSLGGVSTQLPPDEVASLCLGSPIPHRDIQASYLGSPKSDAPNRSDSIYQFSSDDPNLRLVPIMPYHPVHDMSLANEGAAYPYEVKAVPVAVGLGLSVVQVLKVQTGAHQGARQPGSKLIIINGLHRIFRLAELGHTHVAAIVQGIDYNDIPSPFIDSPKEQLFVPKPITVSTFADPAISRRFRWKKAKRVIKLQISVTQEVSYVPE